MGLLWSEAQKYRTWLEVELAAVDAWAELGHVPSDAAKALRELALEKPLDEVFADRVAQLEMQTKHDIVAFTTALTERYGEPARFIHLGLTSTDVVDTAQNMILRLALDIVMRDVIDDWKNACIKKYSK